MFQRVMRFVAIAAILVFAGAWAYGFYMENNFSDFPRHTNPETGQVVPYKWKSTTIYITGEQSDTLKVLHIIEIVSLAFAVTGFVVARMSARSAR